MLFLRRCVDAMPNYLKRWGPERETYAKLRLDMLIIQLDDAARWLINDGITISKDLVVEALLEYWTVGLSVPQQDTVLKRSSNRKVRTRKAPTDAVSTRSKS